ncbi:MAG: P1 family peptidase [Acidobacteriota bacterium]
MNSTSLSTRRAALVLLGLLLLAAPSLAQRARDLGVEPGILPTGPLNGITDVEGVSVGHVTLVDGNSVRTGVTAIVPHGGNLFRQKLPAAVHVANAFGKAAGFLQVQELGTLEVPIVLTNTLSVGTAVEAVVRWTLDQPGNDDVRSVNAVVGETNDGGLNEIRAASVTAAHVRRAIETAAGGAVAEGNVGAGTGTIAFGWKGGIGTSSRRLPEGLGGYTVGVLVQANYGGVLTVDGRRIGEELGKYPYRDLLEGERGSTEDDSADGSCMIVVLTDAPLDARQLERLARRAPLGLARTGSYISHGSGDFVIAASTQRGSGTLEGGTVRTDLLPDRALSPLFLATVEATEEAVINALVAAETMTGHRGLVVEELPHEALGAGEPR